MLFNDRRGCGQRPRPGISEEPSPRPPQGESRHSDAQSALFRLTISPPGFSCYRERPCPSRLAVISQDEFQALAAEGYNRIPLMREVLSDLDTPLSVYLKLADGPYTYLLESVEGGESWGRHSIIGLPCRRVYSLRGKTLTVSEFGEIVATRELADPLDDIDALRNEFRVPRLPQLPAFTGGLVGFF